VDPSADFDERMNYMPSDKLYIRITNNVTAPGMFTQIDVLSLPGAGLRHLDFPQVGSLFQGFFSGDESPSHVHMGAMPSPMSTTSCLVRTYGSEPEM
jgi:hypothetical protein